MNTSSFLCGVVLGAAASMMMSKKRGNMMSSLGQSGGSMGSAADKAKDKIMGMAMTGFGSTASSGEDTHSKKSHAVDNGHKDETLLKSKESNLSMLKDFIRSNPDVKNEVEQILKETHTSIPGL
ncbi:hypothetical protein [Paenibacillus donghaensis]|uniref:Uncharacterized protein n=1 Tax=Paenibacillus donghaensis TaxID=414771 RepID=A0A2Z2K8L2_9BACL|nr:hypothetical protein [Paenibacillus donghaensis]ASA22946.1 hypothetical protein B9T62_20325 [Paenibacillus donghaensis]